MPIRVWNLIGSKTRHKQLENKKDFSKRRERSFFDAKNSDVRSSVRKLRKKRIERSHPIKIRLLKRLCVSEALFDQAKNSSSSMLACSQFSSASASFLEISCSFA